jgi:hypothetical protein
MKREGGGRLALRLLKPAERLCVCCNWPNKSGPPSSLHPSQPAVGVAINLARIGFQPSSVRTVQNWYWPIDTNKVGAHHLLSLVFPRPSFSFLLSLSPPPPPTPLKLIKKGHVSYRRIYLLQLSWSPQFGNGALIVDDMLVDTYIACTSRHACWHLQRKRGRHI